MSVSNMILGTLRGIPGAVHLADGMPDKDLSEIIRMLSAVGADLVGVQRARRKMDQQRRGYPLAERDGAPYDGDAA